MDRATGRRRLTVEVQFRSQATPGGIYGGQSQADTCYPPSTAIFFCRPSTLCNLSS